MQEFLSGAMLAKKIREVCEGDNRRLAVAYWGAGIPEALSLDDCGSSRIICDVSSGGTNPAALKSLGAPSNKNLRHVPKLHAKVYISSIGVTLLHKSADGRGTPFPGQTYPTVSVTGMPSA
ncbi:phospholipase D family protein, partial [Yoonia sp.]|uniref:phospholipase D family protein n=1 Tax=Yoonia sp. TaxID=2212373 RepID=UPI0025DC551C